MATPSKKPPNMSLEEWRAHQVRFSPENQPEGAKRGRVAKTELYGSEIRIIDELIVRDLPYLVQEQLQIAKGLARQQVVNPRTGELVMVDVDARVKAQVGQYLMDRIMGKPETFKHVEERADGTQVVRILIGPAADERRAAIEATAVDVAAPLMLPSPPLEELDRLPPIHTTREIRKVALDEHLKGSDAVETRRAIHEKFGSRDQIRARREAHEQSQ
jgi:hypothetical protein